MLAGLCEYVILGHSERRMYFQEDDAFINKKVAAALAAGLKPILAVGERLEERDAGRMEAVVTRQVRGGLAGIPASEGVVVAYEPVWAIGTGGPPAAPRPTRRSVSFGNWWRSSTARTSLIK